MSDLLKHCSLFPPDYTVATGVLRLAEVSTKADRRFMSRVNGTRRVLNRVPHGTRTADLELHNTPKEHRYRIDYGVNFCKSKSIRNQLLFG
jgi:hypothetical protein